MIIAGIDVGKHGGIAILRENETKVIKMPDDVTEFIGLFDYYKGLDDLLVFVEKLQMRPQDIYENVGKAFRIQRMLADFEKLKATLQIGKIPFCLVNPMKWQSALGLRIKGEEKSDRKHRYVKVAQEHHPNVRATLWNADALLIADFGKKMYEEQNKWLKSNLPTQFNEKLF